MTRRIDLEPDVTGGGQEWNEPEADFAPGGGGVRLVWSQGIEDLPPMDPELAAKCKASLDQIELLMRPAASKAVN